MKFFTKDFFSKYDQIRSFTEEIRCGKLHFLCSVHVMDPWRSRNCVFGEQSYSKNARKLRFHVFLPFYDGKHMIPWFYLKWTELARNCELCSNLVQVPRYPWLKQYSQLRYRMFSSTKNGGIHGVWAFWNFSSNTCLQIYSVWVWPNSNYFCSVMFLSEETCKYSKPGRCALTFFLAK